MNIKLSFQIAKTHLLSKIKQTAVAALGVTFGIAMFIAMVSLMTGLNDFTEELTMVSTPDIRIYSDIETIRPDIIDDLYPDEINVVYNQKPKNERENIKNAFQLVDALRQHPEISGVAPQLTSQVFYNYGPVKLSGIISGVDILEEDKLFDIRSKIHSGSIEDLIYSNDGIIMGTGLADKLNVKKGDRVTITTPEGHTMKLKIVGTFQMGIGTIDNIKSYANISRVQTILQQDSRYITDINIKLKDFTNAKNIAPSIQNQYGYKAEDWETANKTMLTGMVIRDIMTYAVSITLLLVAGFGIYNILTMNIYNKMKDIAILKATGFSGRDVKQIFIIQSLVIGFTGSIFGLIIGYFLAYLISLAPFDGGDFVSLDHMPVAFKMQFYITGIIFGILTTFFAGYFPSQRAAKMDPIEIIRGQ
jgi:lipoprotein-releasing system permease protein